MQQLEQATGSWCPSISEKGVCNATKGCKYEDGKLIYGCRSVCQFHRTQKKCSKRDGCSWTPNLIFSGGTCAYDPTLQMRDLANRVQELEARMGGVRQKLKRWDFCGQFEKSNCEEKWGCAWNNAFFFGQVGGSCESLCPNFTEQGYQVCNLHPMCSWNPRKHFCVRTKKKLLSSSVQYFFLWYVKVGVIRVSFLFLYRSSFWVCFTPLPVPFSSLSSLPLFLPSFTRPLPSLLVPLFFPSFTPLPSFPRPFPFLLSSSLLLDPSPSSLLSPSSLSPSSLSPSSLSPSSLSIHLPLPSFLPLVCSAPLPPFSRPELFEWR